VCGTPITQPASRGRRRRTCSAAHRKALSRRSWPPGFEEAEDALIVLVAEGRESPVFALERIVTAWRAVA
jgi:hypothetical protein